jgi:hypothetical protein
MVQAEVSRAMGERIKEVTDEELRGWSIESSGYLTPGRCLK